MTTLLQPRAALVPMESLGALDGIGEALGSPSWAVSLRDPRPTHLLVTGDPLPRAFAASAVLAGGKLLFSAPDSTSFAEGGAPLPDAVAGSLSFRLRDVAEPLVVRGASRPLERFLAVSWSPGDRAVPAADLAATGVTLRPSAALRPATALVLAEPEIRGLDGMLDAFPESRFDGIRFFADDREVILQAPSPRAIAGIAGAAFHAQELSDRKTLYLPIGRELAPAFAREWMDDLLRGKGMLFFWREEAIQSVDAASGSPLNRRSWRARGRDRGTR